MSENCHDNARLGCLPTAVYTGVLLGQFTIPSSAALYGKLNLQGRADGSGNVYQGKDWQQRNVCFTTDSTNHPGGIRQILWVGSLDTLCVPRRESLARARRAARAARLCVPPRP